MGRLKLFLYIGFIVILSGCALEAESPRRTAVQLKLDIPQRVAAHKATAAPTPSGITTVTLDVTGPGMSSLSAATAVSAGSAAVLEMSVPDGPQRTFTAKAL
ncbi:MAG TPA: hypothetical protein VI382_07670, partial [Candidatus Manganitrophaceae bacterium]|nr:hypothetical protein [Candidatus Manganitrophaceae bacterium]